MRRAFSRGAATPHGRLLYEWPSPSTTLFYVKLCWPYGFLNPVSCYFFNLFYPILCYCSAPRPPCEALKKRSQVYNYQKNLACGAV